MAGWSLKGIWLILIIESANNRHLLDSHWLQTDTRSWAYENSLILGSDTGFMVVIEPADQRHVNTFGQVVDWSFAISREEALTEAKQLLPSTVLRRFTMLADTDCTELLLSRIRLGRSEFATEITRNEWDLLEHRVEETLRLQAVHERKLNRNPLRILQIIAGIAAAADSASFIMTLAQVHNTTIFYIGIGVSSLVLFLVIVATLRWQP